MSLRICAGSLSEPCAQYGMVNSACVVGSDGAGRAATQRDLHAENITDIAAEEPLMRHPVQLLERETKEAGHGQAPRPIGQ